MRLLVLMLMMVLGVAVSRPAAPVAAEWAAPRTVWVEATGHTVDGLFLDAWRHARALLADPVSEEHVERVQLTDETEPTARIVQYFAGGALIYLEESGSVTMLPLGYWALAADLERYPDLPLPDPVACGDLPATECATFENGHSLRTGFKAFWDTNDGAALIGEPISEAFVSDDGVATQYFANAVLHWSAGEAITPRALGLEMATRQQVERSAIPQPEDLPVYREELFIVPLAPDLGTSELADYGPGPRTDAFRELVISRGAQTLWAYESGELVLTTLVSTGTGNVPETLTPLGSFSVHTKLESQTMEGVIAGEHYLVEDVPWVMYFDDGGNALHGAYWHNNFGQPMSHGCVNLPLDVAEYLYSWADYGTPVTIIE